MRNESGFTMIELVVVIVILGILAAIAIPKYVDMTTEARASALQGITASLNSASAVNFAGDLAKGAVVNSAIATATAKTGITTTDDCTDTIASSLVPNGPFGTGAGQYDLAVDSTSTKPVNIGDKTICQVTQVDTGNTATFTLYGAK